MGGRAAHLYLALPGQINLQIPWELAGQNQASIIAAVAGTASNTQSVSLATFAPGIFSANGSGSQQGAILIAPTAHLAAPDTSTLRGGYISIYCTGLGTVTNQPVTGAAAASVPLSFTTSAPKVTIGGVESQVTYSELAPTQVGLYQVNVLVPAGVAPGNVAPVVMRIHPDEAASDQHSSGCGRSGGESDEGLRSRPPHALEGRRMMNTLESRSRIISHVQTESHLQSALGAAGPNGGPVAVSLADVICDRRRKREEAELKAA